MVQDQEGSPHYLLKVEFEQAMKRIDSTLGAQDKELEKLRSRMHDIANACARIPLIEMDMDKLSKAMEKVPRKEDLEYATRMLTTQLDNQDRDTEKRTSANRWLIGLVVAPGFAVLMLILQVIAKKLGLL